MSPLFCAALALVGMCSPAQETQWGTGILSVADGGSGVIIQNTITLPVPSVIELCIDGHPRKRDPNVTYAGLPPKHGYQRDHKIPLCAGGPDTADNVEYEPLDEAKFKDHYEWSMCEKMCRGEITQPEVWMFFASKAWKQQ
jgi:hypothetical protein